MSQNDTRGLDEEWADREAAFHRGELEDDEETLSVFSDDEYLEDQSLGLRVDRAEGWSEWLDMGTGFSVKGGWRECE